MAATGAALGMTDIEAQLAERRAEQVMQAELDTLSEAAQTIALILQNKGYFVIVRPPHKLYRPGEVGAHYAYEIVFSAPSNRQPNMIGLDMVTKDHLVELVRSKVPTATTTNLLIPQDFQMGPVPTKGKPSRR